MGLIYLSIADLHAHDLDEAGLRKIIALGESDNRWLSLIRDICARAHKMERRGLALAESQYSKMDGDCRFILCFIITIYQELLDRIEKHPEYALHCSSMLSRKNKIMLVCKAAEQAGYPFSKLLERFSL